jgi:hypothetical protein
MPAVRGIDISSPSTYLKFTFYENNLTWQALEVGFLNSSPLFNVRFVRHPCRSVDMHKDRSWPKAAVADVVG